MNGPEWLSGQVSGLRCPACDQAYGRSNVRLLAERDGLYFLDLECLSCDSRTVAILTVEVDEGADVTREWLPRATHHADGPPSQRPPIDADDVLDMHQFLAGFEGNVSQLLRAGGSHLFRGAHRG